MHLISVSPKQLARAVEEKSKLLLPPGRYLVEDNTAGELVGRRWAQFDAVYDDYSRSYSSNGGERIILIRPGGLGDLLFLTPTIRQLQKRFQQVAISTIDPWHSFLEGICLALPYPLNTQNYELHGPDPVCVIPLEDWVEYHPAARETHIVELFADACNVKLTPEDMRPHYALRPEEKAAALERFPRIPGAPRIGVQMKASARCRTYPENQIYAALGPLWKLGWEIVLLGAPGEYSGPEQPRFINATSKGLNLRESIALASTCDIIFGPDSFYVHLAGALDIPAVAVYASFPWELRLGTNAAPKSIAVPQGQRLGCAPCFWHSRGSHFPVQGQIGDEMPMCTKMAGDMAKLAADTGRKVDHVLKCEALANIHPSKITTAILNHHAKYYPKPS